MENLSNSNIKCTPELLNQLDECATPEELVKLAKTKNVEISLEEAKEVISLLDKDLTDDELEKVAGGGTWGSDCSQYKCTRLGCMSYDL